MSPELLGEVRWAMDPRHLFVDERLTGICVYCGGDAATSDHVPPKVLLDEPYPPDLPVVPACCSCNASFAQDEQYLACLVDCALSGSAAPSGVGRNKIKRILSENPALAGRLADSQQTDVMGNLTWEAEVGRVRNVVLKLARGHVAYELGLPMLGEPDHVAFSPMVAFSAAQEAEFELPARSSVIQWPEIGSRAFLRAVKHWPSSQPDHWVTVQPRRYRYFVSQSEGVIARFVLSEYLACEVTWQ